VRDINRAFFLSTPKDDKILDEIPDLHFAIPTKTPLMYPKATSQSKNGQNNVMVQKIKDISRK
jgi:hypothetical protein